MTHPISLVVVDDQELVRTGLSAMLARQSDVYVLGTAAAAEEGLDLIAQVAPDVALVDYSLPRMNGVEMCSLIRDRHGHTRVIILGSDVQGEVMLRAVRAGARGYLCKDADLPELLHAVRAVGRGDAVVDARVAGRLMALACGRAARARSLLSDKEVEVLRLVARGATNKEVGVTLGVTENTVKTTMRRIFRKLGCATRAEAAAHAVSNSLL